MKLDEINDIEILRNELKKHMVKCIEEYTYDDEDDIITFKVGEYYYMNQYSDYRVSLYDASDSETYADINIDVLEKYFDV